MAHWEQNFDFYMGWVDEKPASFVIDLNAADHAPVATHPTRLHVRAKMRLERDDGLRDPNELEALGNFEDFVVDKLERAVDAIYAGRMVHDGYTELYFYVPDAAKARLENLGELLGDVPEYEPEWLLEDDAEWEFYGEFLYPDAFARQAMLNRQLLDEIRSNGDANDIPREIDHLAYFETRLNAEAAAARLQAAGFRLDDIEESDDAEEQLRFSLQFHRNDRLDGEHADKFCSDILNIVLDHEGMYDGWGTTIVKP